jgi:hypothetical protein
MDNKELELTKWSAPSNRAWEKEVKIELNQSREIEICIRSRDGELHVLCGLVYLRLEDFLDANATTYCLPLEPQGILLAEMTYEIPRTERRQPKLKRGRRIFNSELMWMVGGGGREERGREEDEEKGRGGRGREEEGGREGEGGRRREGGGGREGGRWREGGGREEEKGGRRERKETREEGGY